MSAIIAECRNCDHSEYVIENSGDGGGNMFLLVCHKWPQFAIHDEDYCSDFECKKIQNIIDVLMRKERHADLHV